LRKNAFDEYIPLRIKLIFLCLILYLISFYSFILSSHAKTLFITLLMTRIVHYHIDISAPMHVSHIEEKLYYLTILKVGASLSYGKSADKQ